jgi:hypothetical protein
LKDLGWRVRGGVERRRVTSDFDRLVDWWDWFEGGILAVCVCCSGWSVAVCSDLWQSVVIVNDFKSIYNKVREGCRRVVGGV